MPGPAVKEFHQYLISSDSKAHVSHEQYRVSPATAFLKYVIEAKDSMNHCYSYFPEKKDGYWTKASEDSYYHISVAMLPAIMGHFETYQRYLFAGSFDLSVWLKGFKIEDLINRLKNSSDLKIDPVRLAAYRGLGMSSVGFLIADTLSGWHNPEKVNQYFHGFGLKHSLFSATAINRLRVLWQLRHSIVHTGGTLTRADAQKVPELESFADEQVLFDEYFIFEVARKLHPLIKDATKGFGSKFKKQLKSATPSSERNRAKELFDVKSSAAVWLR